MKKFQAINNTYTNALFGCMTSKYDRKLFDNYQYQWGDMYDQEKTIEEMLRQEFKGKENLSKGKG